jgi:hypothetical protein
MFLESKDAERLVRWVLGASAVDREWRRQDQEEPDAGGCRLIDLGERHATKDLHLHFSSTEGA